MTNAHIAFYVVIYQVRLSTQFNSYSIPIRLPFSFPFLSFFFAVALHVNVRYFPFLRNVTSTLLFTICKSYILQFIHLFSHIIFHQFVYNFPSSNRSPVSQSFLLLPPRISIFPAPHDCKGFLFLHINYLFHRISFLLQ